MSGYTVTTPFNTPTRRFAAGQPVTEADLDGPLSLEDRIRLGHIAVLKAAKPGKGKDSAAPDQTDTPAG